MPRTKTAIPSPRKTSAKEAPPKKEPTTVLVPPPDAEIFAQPMTFGLLFNRPVTELTTPECAGAFSVLKVLSKAASERQEEMRLLMLNDAEEHGEKLANGSFRYLVDGNEILAEKRTQHLPGEDALKALLLSSGVPVADVFDEVPTLVLNPSKLDFLIQTGRISQKMVDDLKSSNFALKLNPNDKVKHATGQMKKRISSEP